VFPGRRGRVGVSHRPADHDHHHGEHPGECHGVDRRPLAHILPGTNAFFQVRSMNDEVHEDRAEKGSSEDDSHGLRRASIDLVELHAGESSRQTIP